MRATARRCRRCCVVVGWVRTREEGEGEGDSIVVVVAVRRHYAIVIVLSCRALRRLSSFVVG